MNMPHRRTGALMALALATPLVLGVRSGQAEELPVVTGAKDQITSRIEPIGDVDEFGIFLLPGDLLSVKVNETGPVRDLKVTLTLLNTADENVTSAAFVSGQGTFRASFKKFEALALGTYVVRVEGSGSASSGRNGHFKATFRVKRAKTASATFDEAAGGTFHYAFKATEGALLKLNAKTKKGGFEITELTRPDGTTDPDFLAALNVKGNRRSAKAKKYPLSGGAGDYELSGTYDPGSSVKIAAKLKHADKKRKRELGDFDPRLDPHIDPFPSRGIGTQPTAGLDGTEIRVAMNNVFTDPGEVDDNGGNVSLFDDIKPTFELGGIAVPPGTVSFTGGFGDAQFTFPAPEGLTPGTTCSLVIVNSDGHRVLHPDAFDVIPPPQIDSLSTNEAGPAGGQRVDIHGTWLKDTEVVLFGGRVAPPEPNGITESRVVVFAPVHAAGTVDLTVRDRWGQTATLPAGFVYLDRGVNTVTGIDLPWLQGLGGETVVVNGTDFQVDTELTLDGEALDAQRVSDTEMRFTMPPYPGGTYELRATDRVDQTHALDVDVHGLVDDSANAIPDPLGTANAVDGWRATKILVGDVDGDMVDDLVLLRTEKAFGNDVNRQRIRVLLGDGVGGFTDDTANAIPVVSGDEDWRADDGVLVNLNAQPGLDLAIVTSDSIDSGTRSSLRVLLNDGTGVFTDNTSTGIPAGTTYGDINQGSGIVAADVNDDQKMDLVIVHDESFMEVIVTDPPPPDPNDPNPPPPPDTETFYYPGTRLFLNDGAGSFTRDLSLPAYDADRGHNYEGDAIVAGDVDGDTYVDLLVTRDDPLEDPNASGTYLLTAIALINDDTGAFTDESSSVFPAASNPEFLQGDRLYLVDVNDDQEDDLIVSSDLRLVNPVTGAVLDTPATRIFEADGNGAFAAPTTDPMPSADGSDASQAHELAVGDLTGDGDVEIVLISATAPNISQIALRPLVYDTDGYFRGNAGLPPVSAGDDYRGHAIVLLDVDGDGDLDVIVARSEADESVRNTRVLLNPQND